jgi:hypothetical protein
MERHFTLRVNVKRTIETEEYDTVTIFASSLAEAKEKAEEECRAFNDATTQPGGTLISIDCEFEGLVDDETGDEYLSLGIERGDDELFADEDDEEELN